MVDLKILMISFKGQKLKMKCFALFVCFLIEIPCFLMLLSPGKEGKGREKKEKERKRKKERERHARAVEMAKTCEIKYFF